MVVGTLQHVPSRGRISIMKIQNFTVQKRSSVIKLSYGFLLVIISTVMAAINPINIFTTWFMEMKEGSFLFKMWENPPYELLSEVYVYNYTNIEEFKSGQDKVLKIKEVGPFMYREVRTNENMKIDKERGVMTMNPKMKLEFLPEKSIDYPENVTIMMPNIPLIALSTLAADRLGYLVNSGAYYSMSVIGSKLFIPLTVQKMLWGYHDPLVTIANTLLPGWIDFAKLGLMDRLYSGREEWSEIELGDASRRYSVNKWDNSTGLREQGFTDWNTSIPCNRITGSYEGVMLPPNFPKGKGFSIFRKQACRNYPFAFQEEKINEFGVTSYRYLMEDDAFSKKSKFACPCTDNNCVPEGFVDVSQCYYGFPIVLTKPHYLDAAPQQQAFFEGMTPNKENDTSFMEIEPTLGVPLKFAIKVQINLAVRTSPANPITLPLKNKIVPLMWFSLHCVSPPQDIITLLRLHSVIAPPLLITFEVLLFLIGFYLGGLGFYRIWKPKYKILAPKEKPAPIRRKSQDRRRSSVILNLADSIVFRQTQDEDLAKEAVSLLAINEDEGEFHELLLSDHEFD